MLKRAARISPCHPRDPLGLWPPTAPGRLLHPQPPYCLGESWHGPSRATAAGYGERDDWAKDTYSTLSDTLVLACLLISHWGFTSSLLKRRTDGRPPIKYISPSHSADFILIICLQHPGQLRLTLLMECSPEYRYHSSQHNNGLNPLSTPAV